MPVSKLMADDDPSLPATARVVPDILRHAASLHGARPATDFFGASLTYAQLEAAVTNLARGLQAIGVARGCHVGLLLPNSPQFITAYYAALYAGAVVVNLNPLYAIEELEMQARDARIDVLVTLNLTELLAKANELLRSGAVERIVVAPFTAALPTLKALAFRTLHRAEMAPADCDDRRVLSWDTLMERGAQANAALPNILPDDLAVLQFTGGTTGLPKAAMLTHANLTANVRQIRLWFADVQEGRERIMPFCRSSMYSP